VLPRPLLPTLSAHLPSFDVDSPAVILTNTSSPRHPALSCHCPNLHYLPRSPHPYPGTEATARTSANARFHTHSCSYFFCCLLLATMCLPLRSFLFSSSSFPIPFALFPSPSLSPSSLHPPSRCPSHHSPSKAPRCTAAATTMNKSRHHRRRVDLVNDANQLSAGEMKGGM
jgi:hypothetical protein